MEFKIYLISCWLRKAFSGKKEDFRVFSFQFEHDISGKFSSCMTQRGFPLSLVVGIL